MTSINLAQNYTKDSLNTKQISINGYSYTKLYDEIMCYLLFHNISSIVVTNKLSCRYEQLIDNLSRVVQIYYIDVAQNTQVDLYGFSNVAVFIEAVDDDTYYINDIATLASQHPSIYFITDFEYQEPVCRQNVLGFVPSNSVIIDTKSPQINISIYDTSIYKDTRDRVYMYMCDVFGSDLSLVSPLDDILLDAIPIRLDKLVASELIRACNIDDIILINSMQCYLGHKKPSKTLQAFGYTQSQARELLSISVANEYEKIIQAIDKIYILYKQCIQFK